jgi:hypothetical protein
MGKYFFLIGRGHHLIEDERINHLDHPRALCRKRLKEKQDHQSHDDGPWKLETEPMFSLT